MLSCHRAITLTPQRHNVIEFQWKLASGNLA